MPTHLGYDSFRTDWEADWGIAAVSTPVDDDTDECLTESLILEVQLPRHVVESRLGSPVRRLAYRHLRTHRDRARAGREHDELRRGPAFSQQRVCRLEEHERPDRVDLHAQM